MSSNVQGRQEEDAGGHGARASAATSEDDTEKLRVATPVLGATSDVCDGGSGESCAVRPRLVCEIWEGPVEARRRRVVTVDTTSAYFGRSQVHLERVVAEEKDRIPSAQPTYDVLQSEVVSSIHCKVWYEEAVRQWFVCDCKSRNGTWFAPPAPDESLKKYLFLGDKKTKGEHQVLTIMSSIKAANVVILITNIEGMDNMRRLDGFDALNYTDGGTVTEDVSKQDMVVQVVNGPGAGQHQVVKYPESCIVGRAAGQTPSPAAAAASPDGATQTVDDLTATTVTTTTAGAAGGPARERPSDGAHPASGTPGKENRFMIHTTTRYLSRRHALIRHSPDTSARPITVQCLSKNGCSFCRQPDLSGVKSFSHLDWKPIPYNSTSSLSFGDLLLCGKDTILLIADHAGPPQRLQAPHRQGATATSLSLAWDAAISPTDVKGYILQCCRGPSAESGEAEAGAQVPLLHPDGGSAELMLRWRNVFGGAKCTATLGSLEPNTVYMFRIRARNAGGESPWSEVVAYATDKQGVVHHSVVPSWLVARLVAHNRELVGGDGTAGGALTGYDPAHATDDDDDTDTTSFLQLPSSEMISHRLPSAVLRKEGSSIRWQKGKLIGLGAQGKVYAGQDLDDMTVMAVKEIICMERDLKQADVLAVQAEMEMLAKLDHPNIVRYIGMNQVAEGGQVTIHIFLEYVAGGSLRDFIKKVGEGGLDENVCKVYTKQILQGLQYLHAQNYVHRDIKSANILLAVFGRQQVCKIADFGASKSLSKLSDDFQSVVGTANFMAPEVVRAQGGSHKSDIWSVGCTVIEMLTGRPPWAHLEPQAALYQVGSTRTGPALPDGISEHCRAFLGLCFKIDPHDRASAEELIVHPWLADVVDVPTDSMTVAATAPGTPSTDATPASVATTTTTTTTTTAAAAAATSASAASALVLNTAVDHVPGATALSPSFRHRSHVIPTEELHMLEDIGVGGFGKVRKAEYLGVMVAIKFLTHVENIDAFIKEASLLSELRHPNTVLYMGVVQDEAEQRFGIVMEYLDGGDLHHIIHPRTGEPSLDVATRLRVLRDVASGLVYLHAHGIAHRDIKLRNILLDKHRSVAKLADFGLSAPEEQTAATYRYAAPEVLAGNNQADTMADVYSFGLVMYEVMTGVKPFASLRDAKKRVYNLDMMPGDPPGAPCPASLSDLIMRCCAVDVSQRPGIRQVLDHIKLVLDQWRDAHNNDHDHMLTL